MTERSSRERTKTCPTASLVVMTEQGDSRSFSPLKFQTKFRLTGSSRYVKPLPLTNDRLKCLVIPRPAENVSQEGYKEEPSTKKEFYQMRDHYVSKSKIVKNRVFTIRGWDRKEGWETPA